MVLRNLWSPEKHFKVKRSLFKILIYSDCVPVFVMNLFLLYIYSIFKDYSSYDIPSKYISGQGIIHHYVGKLEPYSINFHTAAALH